MTKYIERPPFEWILICVECGSLVNKEHKSRHDQFHLNLLRGTLHK